MYEKSDLVLRMISSANNCEPIRQHMLSIAKEVMASSKQAIKQRSNGNGLGAYSSDEWLEIMELGIGRGSPYFEPRQYFEPNTSTQIIDNGEIFDSLYFSEFDLFADEMIRNGEATESIKKVIKFIKDELRFPWLDRRIPFKEPSQAELFTLITGETDTNLHPGMKVTATVEGIPNDYKATLRIDGGLRASLNISDASDQEVTHIADAVSDGQTLNAVILRVNKDYNIVEVTTKESFLTKPEHWWIEVRTNLPEMQEWTQQTGRLNFDKSFNEDRAISELAKLFEDEEIRARKKAESDLKELKASRPKFENRPIHHPAFKNYTFQMAEKELLELGVDGLGEHIFRPGENTSQLKLSWLVTENSVRHITIQEEGKPSDESHLGTRLLVRGEPEPYADLDDLIANYITPMNDLVSQMMEFSKFKLGNTEDIYNDMKATKRTHPKKIPVWIRLDPLQPGYFVLTHLPNVDRPAATEYISLSPRGYSYKGMTYDHPRKIIAIWQQTMMKKYQKPTTGGTMTTNGDAAQAPTGRVRRSRFTDAAEETAPRRSRFQNIE